MLTSIKRSLLQVSLSFLTTILVTFVAVNWAHSQTNTDTNGPSSTPEISKTPSETTKIVEEPKPSQLVVNIATLLNAGWPWAIIIPIFIIVFFKRKELGGLLGRMVKDASSVSFGNVSVEMKNKGEESKFEAEAETMDSEMAQPPPAVDESEPDLINPKSGQDDPSLFTQLYSAAYVDRDLVLLEELYNEINSANADAPIVSEAQYAYLRYQAGNSESIVDLKELAEDKNEPDAWRYLGYYYRSLTKVREAIDCLEKAAALEEHNSTLVVIVTEIAKLIFNSEGFPHAAERITKAIREESDLELKSQLYKALANLNGEANDFEMKALCLEKAVELTAFPQDLLFDLAYAHCESDHLVLGHETYMALLSSDSENEGAWNNIGVAREKLKLPFASVQAYTQAVREGNSLAAANIAFRLINAGFQKLASDQIDLAQKLEDVHENVAKAQADLIEQQANEVALMSKFASDSTQQREFLRAYAEALIEIRGETPDLSGTWRFKKGGDAYSKDAEIGSITVDGNTFEGLWCYGMKKISGSITNWTFDIYTYKSEYSAYTQKSVLKSDKKAKGYLESNGKRIVVMMDDEMSDEVIWTIERDPSIQVDVEPDDDADSTLEGNPKIR